MKQGGFWQVEFGNVITINLPKDSKINIDEIIMTFYTKRNVKNSL